MFAGLGENTFNRTIVELKSIGLAIVAGALLLLIVP